MYMVVGFVVVVLVFVFCFSRVNFFPWKTVKIIVVNVQNSKNKRKKMSTPSIDKIRIPIKKNLRKLKKERFKSKHLRGIKA